MRLNFRKISALASSALMVGMTAGIAAAANYPAPFVSGGQADVAIVHGTGAGVSALDAVQAGNIQTDLAAFVSGGGGSTVEGGDSFKFEKASTKFHLGDNITQVVSSSLDDDELPTLLAEGTYLDDDLEEKDYTQTITMGANVQLTMFEDNDYAEDEPTVGFRIIDGTNILNYTLDFSDEPSMTKLETTDLPLMGRTYFIQDVAANGDLTLLDSANSVFLNQVETVTAAGHSVSIAFVSASEVRLTIDGTQTNSLEEGQTQRLSDGSYVSIKDILFSSKEGEISSVDFSIGSGKLELLDGQEVQLNDENVPGLKAFITNTTTLSTVILQWDADDEVFVTTTGSATMPGFEAVKLSFGGLNYPAEEAIEIEAGSTDYAVLDNFPLKDTTTDIPLLYGSAGAFSGIGKDSTSELLTAAPGGTQNMTFDEDIHDFFVVSWVSGDDAESYLVRVNNFRNDSGTLKVDFEQHKNGAWVDVKTNVKKDDTFSIGNAELAAGAIDTSGDTVSVWNNSVNTNFDQLYSATGLKIHLPYLAANTSLAPGAVNFSSDGTGGQIGHNATSFHLTLVEEDKDDLAAGDTINATLGWNSDNEVEPTTYATTNTDAVKTEIGDTDVWRDFTYSHLATEILSSEPTSGQNSLKLIYHGGEVAADVFIAESGATVVGGGGALGGVVVRDSEVSSVSSKNLVVVGGSCINSVAASLVGGALCGSSWTASTGVGSGQFLIQSFAGSSSGKVSLLVAGYDAADTVNAATYLTTTAQPVDTAVGKKYVGTSSTSAELQVS